MFKTVNDSAGPNGIIPTLLVFKLYLRMTDLDLPVLSVTKRAYTIHKASKEVWWIHAECQLTDVLAIWNDLNTLETLNLPINLNVCVWWENKG